MNTNLVKMSGQFWKVTLNGTNIVLVSTILGLKAKMSFAAFTGAIIRGSIQTMGGI